MPVPSESYRALSKSLMDQALVQVEGVKVEMPYTHRKTVESIRFTCYGLRAAYRLIGPRGKTSYDDLRLEISFPNDMVVLTIKKRNV